jgi:hypothetical protein
MNPPTLQAPVDARVIETPHGFKVLPKDVFKHTGDGFTLLNLTASTVHVSFPELPTDPPNGDIPPSHAKTFAILDTQPGIYEYWVAVGITDNNARSFTLRASGGSDPNIIIDF